MASPLATEKVLRGVLQSLQRAGIVVSGADVSKLEQIPNNATDVDISAILDTIAFGSGAATGGSLASDGDVDVFIDADDNDSALINTRYFRVSQNQGVAPVTDQAHELLTAADLAFNVTAHYPTLTIGARTALCTSNQGALLNIGSSTTAAYGQFVGASGELYSGLSGLSIRSSSRLEFRTDESIMVTDANANYLRGGWEDPASYARLHVGDFTASPAGSLAIEAEDTGGGYEDFTIRPTDTSSTIRRIYIRGSNAASGYRSHTIIGGKSGESWADPTSFTSPTLLVVGDDISTTASAMYIYDRKTARASSSEVFTIKSEAECGGLFYYLRIIDSRATIGPEKGVFNIDSTYDANLASGGAYNATGADVAESIVTEESYKPGTVLAILDGKFVKTSAVGQSNVAGVVATSPGVVLGSPEDPTEKADRTKLAICGFVPVLCSTDHGDIRGNGETLVSGPDGCAVVDPNPKPGTIIGKAKGRLLQDGDTAVKGLVDVLVNLQ